MLLVSLIKEFFFNIYFFSERSKEASELEPMNIDESELEVNLNEDNTQIVAPATVCCSLAYDLQIVFSSKKNKQQK